MYTCDKTYQFDYCNGVYSTLIAVSVTIKHKQQIILNINNIAHNIIIHEYIENC